jgi:hypothetical protein
VAFCFAMMVEKAAVGREREGEEVGKHTLLIKLQA